MAFDESLNTRNISTNLANYEAARSNFFVLQVYDLDNLLNINYTGEKDAATDADYMKNSSEYLRLNVVKCKMQDFTIDTLEYKRGNDIVKMAGLPKWEAGSITVDDVVGLDTKSILTAWLHLAYNPHTRKGGRMVDYKKSCDLLEYTQDYQLIRTWHLEGCFVTSVSNDEFDKEAGDGKRQIQADISYDRAIMELPEEENA